MIRTPRTIRNQHTTPSTPTALVIALLAPLALAGCSDDMDMPFEAVPGGATANGLTIPVGFQDWPVLGIARRTDNETIRVITGNATAVEAARSGNTNPWPDGSVLADIVWAQSANPLWADMYGAGEYRALALMVKNSTTYADDGGWAYGVWSGLDMTPSDDVAFDRDCVDCHVTNAPENDYVFMRVAQMPNPGAAAAASPTPNGLTVPENFAEWRVLGVAEREPDNGSFRVVTGNDIAVDAARAGNTNPWPDGAMIADLVWAQSTNPDSPDMVAPGQFNALALMVKDSVQYAADGGWGYGIWTGQDLAAPQDPAFAADCISCHVDNAPGTDYVFTTLGALPN